MSAEKEQPIGKDLKEQGSAPLPTGTGNRTEGQQKLYRSVNGVLSDRSARPDWNKNALSDIAVYLTWASLSGLA